MLIDVTTEANEVIICPRVAAVARVVIEKATTTSLTRRASNDNDELFAELDTIEDEDQLDVNKGTAIIFTVYAS